MTFIRRLYFYIVIKKEKLIADVESKTRREKIVNATFEKDWTDVDKEIRRFSFFVLFN